MNIQLIPIDQFKYEQPGMHLVRTISNSVLKNINYLKTNITYNTSKQKIQINVHNQIVTHISINQIK